MRPMMLTVLLAMWVAVAPAPARTLDEVLARHVAARGGIENWNEIRTMKITGNFTAFSKVKPFTLHRKRDNRFHMDHHLGDKLVVMAHDGQQAWWDNRWFQEGAQPIEGADLAVVVRDADFINPLFDHAERGHRLELLGETDFEGEKTIGISVTRADGLTETWYLDPRTYLEVGRVSPGSDFGRPMDQRTYFDDFREAGGVVLPFWSETQWYTRDRVMQIESVEFNVPVDDALFRMPAPLGMERFQSLAGDWDVAAERRQQPGAEWSPSEYSASIESLMKGALFREVATTAEGIEIIRTLSYDRFHQRYRLTSINGLRTQMDVQEGALEDDRLVLSNVATGTSWDGFGFTFNTRTTLLEITADGFRVEHEISTDGGENWFLAARATYSRSSPGA